MEQIYIVEDDKNILEIEMYALRSAGYEVNLTDETVSAIVNGFMMWLSDKTGKTPEEMKISVGRDSRISGPQIAGVTKNTLFNAGVYVIDCGMASTQLSKQAKAETTRLAYVH